MHYTCIVCGKPFEAKPAIVKLYGQCCSHACKVAKNGRSIQLTCPVCGKHFTFYRSRVEAGARYCSNACSTIARGKTRITKTCAFCGKPFSFPPSQLKQGRKYCSHSCYARAAKINHSQSNAVCLVCGKPFHTNNSARANGGGKYCSNTCQRIGQQRGEYRQCPQCGREFYVSRAYQRKGQGTYCSRHCYLEHLHQISKLGRNNWQERAWRMAVLARDNYTCQHCGARDNLHAHHIKTRFRYPELRYDVSNGVTLCMVCHAKEHPHVTVLQRNISEPSTHSISRQVQPTLF